MQDSNVVGQLNSDQIKDKGIGIEPSPSGVQGQSATETHVDTVGLQASPSQNDAVSNDATTLSQELGQHISNSQSVLLPVSLLEQLTAIVKDTADAKKRALRWKYAFRWSVLAVVCIVLAWSFVKNMGNNSATQKHIALIKLEGNIEIGAPAGAEPMINALQAAFEDVASVAIVLQMNSPGGSPVQASMIFDEINRLRSKFNKPVYAVVEEVCASGCYYVAAAADDIYVNPSSLVGSIGVLMDGFGVTELMKKVGVERRLYTAGENKGMLDPFSPSTQKQTLMIKEMLLEVHAQFIEAVRLGRADRLNETPDMFSGRVFTGQKSIALGLADEIGSVSTVAREVVELDNIVDYSPHENIAERVAKKLGASFGAGAMQSILKTNVVGGVR